MLLNRYHVTVLTSHSNQMHSIVWYTSYMLAFVWYIHHRIRALLHLADSLEGIFDSYLEPITLEQ
jgi:hypothetical protein